MYTADYDDIYMHRLAGTNTPNVDHWVDLVQPYVRNKRITQCPDYKAPLNRDPSLTWWGYGVNTHVMTPLGDPDFSTTQFVDAAATALIADASLGDFYARPGRRTRIAFANSAETSPDRLACADQRSRHGNATGLNMNNGGSTVGFADGHAKFQTSAHIMHTLGIHPDGPKKGDALFYEGSSGRYCVGGPVIGP